MFLNTFGLKEWSVLNWVASAEPHGMTTSQNTKCTERRANRQTGNEAKEKLCKFLDSLPSHYCRKSTSRIYLEPTGGNMTDVYMNTRGTVLSMLVGQSNHFLALLLIKFFKTKTLHFNRRKRIGVIPVFPMKLGK